MTIQNKKIFKSKQAGLSLAVLALFLIATFTFVYVSNVSKAKYIDIDPNVPYAKKLNVDQTSQNNVVQTSFDASPTVTLIVSDTETTNVVVLTATAVDTGTNAGIKTIQIFENNNLIAEKNCNGLISCSLTKTVVHNVDSPTTYSYVAYAKDITQHQAESDVIEVTFNPLNTQPQLNIPDITTDEDNSVELFLDDYATDADGDLLYYDVLDCSSQITYELSGERNQTLVLTPQQDWYGQASCSVVALDGKGGYDIDNFTIDVLAENDAPQLNVPDFSMDEDTSLTIDLHNYSYDVDNSLTELSYACDVVAGNLAIDLQNNLLTITPAQDWYGNATISCSVSDGELTDEDSFVVTVLPVNDAPQLNIPDMTMDEDTNLSIELQQYTLDVDNELEELSYNCSTSSTNIGLTLNHSSLTITPKPNWYGQANVVCEVSDGELSDTDEFIVNVINVNDPPTLNLPDPIMFNEDTTYELKAGLYANDIDTPLGQLEWQVNTNESNLHIAIDEEPRSIDKPKPHIFTVYFIPEENWNGVAEVCFTVSDGEYTAQQCIKVIVNAVNDAPTRPTLLEPTSGIYGGNNSEMQIECNGSTDVDNDELSYEIQVFYDGVWHSLGLSEGNVLFDVSNITTQQIDIRCRAFDGAAYSKWLQPTTQLYVDNSAPISTANITSGWYNTPQAVELSCTEVGYTDCSIIYCLSQTNCTPDTLYEEPFIIDQQGVNYLNFYAFDALNNTEAMHSLTIGIDYTQPNITIWQPENNAVYNTSKLNLTYNITDNIALQQCWYTLDGISNTIDCNSSIAELPELADGEWQLHVYATDVANNTASASVVFSIDTIAPDVTIIQPENKTYVHTTSVPLEYTAINATYCWYVLDDSSHALPNCENTTLTNLTDGLHYVEVYARDDANNTGRDSVYFSVVYNTPPSIMLVSPANNTIVNSSVTLEWNATDADNDSLTFYVYINDNLVNTTTEQSINIQLDDGTYTWYVIADDGYDAVQSEIWQFTVDATQPFVNVTAPEHESWQQGTIQFNATASDNTAISTVEFYVDGWQQASLIAGNEQDGVWTLQFDTTTVNDCSAFYIAAKATDAANNTAYDNDTVIYIDNIPPSISYVKTNESVVQSGSTIYVSSDGTDNCDVVSCWLFLYDENAQQLDSQNIGTDCEGPYTLPDLSDGIYYIAIRVRDHLNEAWANTSITVDNTAPTITILQPENNSYTHENVTLEFIADDNEATQLYCNYTLDNTTYDIGVVEVSQQTNINITNLAEGGHSIYVTCSDDAGNIGNSDIVYFTTDLTAPTIEIVYPENKSYNITITLINASVVDNYAISSVVAEIDATQNITLVQQGSYWYNDTISIGEGVHSITIYAFDGAGNSASAQVSFVVDQTAPIVTILQPENNAVYNVRDVDVNFTAVDELTNVEACWYELQNLINASSITNIIVDCNNFTLYNLSNANYSLTIYANDTAGNIGIDNVNFTVAKDETAPAYYNISTSPESPTIYGSGPYNFSIEWQDDFNIANVVFEFDNVNYTPVCNPDLDTLPSLTQCWYTFNDLAAGNHSFRWYAVDAANNMNVTTINNYIIEKANATLSLLLNGIDDDITINQTDTVNITAILTIGTGTIDVYENSTLIASDNDIVTVLKQYNQTGYYNITAIYKGNQNYTGASVTHFITVLDATPPVITLIDPENNTSINAIFSSVNVTFSYEVYDADSDIAWCALYINNTMQQNNSNVTENTTETFTVSLSPGTYEWYVVCADNSENSNTAQSETRILHVLYHDLAVSDITTNASLTTWLYDVINITADITNNGNVDENDVEVLLKVNGNVVQSKLLNLSAGSTQQVSFEWQAQPKGNVVLRVEVNISDNNNTNNYNETSLTVWSVRDVINETEFDLQFDNNNPAVGENFTLAYRVDEIYPGNDTFYNLKITILPDSLILYECISRDYNNWSCEPESGPEPQYFNITDGYNYAHYRKLYGDQAGTYTIYLIAGNNEIIKSKNITIG